VVLAARRGGSAAGDCATGREAARSAGVGRAGGLTSRPASALDSVMTPSPLRAAGGGGRPAVAAAGVEVGAGTLAMPSPDDGRVGTRAGGIASGGSESRRGISIGTSTGIGRGCVSKTSGKPMMPIASKTIAPISRWRARVRACCTASAGSSLGLSGAGSRFCLNMLGRAFANAKGVASRRAASRTAQAAWRPVRCGNPFSSTPPTV